MSNSHTLISLEDPIIDELYGMKNLVTINTESKQAQIKKAKKFIQGLFNDHLRQWSFSDLPLLAGRPTSVVFFDEILTIRLRDGI